MNLVSKNWGKIIGALFWMQVVVHKTSAKNLFEQDFDDSGLRGVKNLPDNVPLSDIEKFKDRNTIKGNAKTDYQKVKGKSFKVNGETFSLNDNDLIPIDDLFTEGAIYMHNGEVQSLPSPAVFRSKKDKSMLVSKTKNGKLLWASGRKGGKPFDIIPIETGSDVFATVENDDVDEEELNKKFKYGETEPVPGASSNSTESEGTRYLKAITKNIETNPFVQSDRSLQSCSQFEVIEVAVAYESFFCEDFGNDPVAADNAVMTTVAEASVFYQQAGLCKKLAISHMEGYCNSNNNNDPYISIMQAGSVCGGSNTLLDRFRQYWATNKGSVQRDIAHLFHGKQFSTNVIGCAYLDVLCNTGYGYGVNYITYTATTSRWPILFAHEAGHNSGANHDCGTCNFIMRPSICGACTTWSESSIDQILDHINEIDCIDPEGPGCTSGTDCSDNDDCTTDTCSNGSCSNVVDENIPGCGPSGCSSATDCDDGDDCSIDSCNAQTGECENTPVDCDDGDECTVENCNAGVCENVFDPNINGCDPNGQCAERAEDCSEIPCCEGMTCRNYANIWIFCW